MTADASTPPRINPDQALVLDFLREPGMPRRVDTNPVALDVQAELLRWDAQGGWLHCGFLADARHTQGNAAVHGGIVTTMLDFGLAFAVLGRLPEGRSAATVSLNMQFERAVQPGSLRVRARVDRLGARLAFAAGELYRDGAEGDVLARASAVMALLG